VYLYYLIVVFLLLLSSPFLFVHGDDRVIIYTGVVIV